MKTRLALTALLAALALAACDQTDSSKPKPAAQRPGSSIAGPKSATAAPNGADKPSAPSGGSPKPMNTGGSPNTAPPSTTTPPANPTTAPDAPKPEAPKPEAPKPETPMPSDAPKDGVLKHTESNTGLIMDDMKFGTGVEAKAHQTVTIQYRGTLPSGVEFDSSYKTGKPATFPLDNLIKGWQEGIPGMKVGGKRRLIVPPDLGYGNREIKGADGKVLIPANSMLIFDIELLAVQ